MKPSSPRSDGLSRRQVLLAGGLTLAGLPRLPSIASASEAGTVTIRMKSDPTGAKVYFDPIGVLVMPGTTIRWVVQSNVHTTTAYHPANGDFPQRIPDAADPWDSGYLTEPGASFSVTLTVEGVYDYFCRPHEAAGMVGRIIVGRPAGPGLRPPGDELPPAAREAFPSIEDIMKRTRVAPA